MILVQSLFVVKEPDKAVKVFMEEKPIMSDYEAKLKYYTVSIQLTSFTITMMSFHQKTCVNPRSE